MRVVEKIRCDRFVEFIFDFRPRLAKAVQDLSNKCKHRNYLQLLLSLAFADSALNPYLVYRCLSFIIVTYCCQSLLYSLPIVTCSRLSLPIMAYHRQRLIDLKNQRLFNGLTTIFLPILTHSLANNSNAQ